MDEAALDRLLDDVRDGDVPADDAVAAAAAPALRRSRLRPGRPPPGAPPGAGRGRLRAGQDARAVRGHRRRAPRRRGASPVLLTRADDDAGRPRRPRRTPAATRTGTTVVWRPAPPASRASSSSSPPAPPTCPSPTSAPPTLAAYGIDPAALTDVGVAGVHRLLAVADELVDADAVVVVAGMEGALASLVGGLTAAPVVAVPTSVGYGASLEGVTALLAMLVSCAAGLTVVGIDNGFGAACAVLRMLGTVPPGTARSAAIRRGCAAAPGPARWSGEPWLSHQARRELVIPEAVTVAWFHCFSGIAGDMALGALVDAGADLDEVRDLCERLPVGGWALEAEPVLRGGIGAHQGPRAAPRRRPSCARPATSPRWSRRPACPTGCASARWPRSPRWPRPRAACTAARPSRCTSTRSAASTPSSTSSAPARRSRCSTSTRSASAPSPTASAWSAPRTGCCRTRRPRSSSCSRGAPTYGLDLAVELTTPDGRGPARRARRRLGPDARR